jgi:16S rRNA (cytidine1402-2'-O)-methyltransferase
MEGRKTLMNKGKLYMAPMTLGTDNWSHVIPQDTANLLNSLRHFVVEDVKTARRYLRKIDREFPIDDSSFEVLNKKTASEAYSRLLKPILEGHDIAVLSEAGCPGIADPGAELVARAHELEIEVVPLVGPSSILLTLMASGFNGQQFRFSGYLPKERKERNKILKDLEYQVKRTGETQLFMDTPFRNVHVLEDMYEVLEPETLVCVACNLTHPDGFVITVPVKDFDKIPGGIDKKPVMFAIGRN